MHDLTQQARTILTENERGGYIVPRPGLYPFQWNWDSCLVALGLSTYDEPRAWQEIETLFSGQWKDGMVPHIIFHRESHSYCPGPDQWRAEAPSGLKTSGISNPPVAAFAVRKMFEGAKDKTLAEEKLQLLIPKLFAWHRWFHEVRDPDATGLVTTYHPWETGRDNSHDWHTLLKDIPLDGLEPYERRDTQHIDAEQRPGKDEYDAFMALVHLFRRHNYDDSFIRKSSPFKVEDTTINFMLARADRDLLHLMQTTAPDKFTEEIALLQKWIATSKQGLPKLWNEEEKIYQPVNLLTGRHVGGKSSGAFLSFLAGLDQKDHTYNMLATLDQWHEVGLLVPSFDPAHPDYEPLRYWMGPVWAIVDFLIYEGLQHEGHIETAEKIAVDTLVAMRVGGLSEYYHPQSCEGLGGKSFSWTGSMWLYWLAPLAEALEDKVTARLAQFRQP